MLLVCLTVVHRHVSHRNAGDLTKPNHFTAFHWSATSKTMDSENKERRLTVYQGKTTTLLSKKSIVLTGS